VLAQKQVTAETSGEKAKISGAADRPIICCGTCGLTQYQTQTGNCRRCARPQPLKIDSHQASGDAIQVRVRLRVEDLAKIDAVEGIGLRVKKFREALGITQYELQERSGVSRSYLSRIEIGMMTPGLGTLEKIADALEISLNRFFQVKSMADDLLDDPFINELRPFLHQLDAKRREAILKSVAAINNHVRGYDSDVALAPSVRRFSRTKYAMDRSEQRAASDQIG